ncbi:MAG: hypothetical protein OXF84_08280 [Bacteroidetes bacterium]|nr:hypothetical protein [Bacteroidota bacterium]
MSDFFQIYRPVCKCDSNLLTYKIQGVDSIRCWAGAAATFDEALIKFLKEIKMDQREFKVVYVKSEFTRSYPDELESEPWNEEVITPTGFSPPRHWDLAVEKLGYESKMTFYALEVSASEAIELLNGKFFIQNLRFHGENENITGSEEG